ncbi:hypothetical protein HQ535_02985, partial [bacterium]|nr:hypothetical protein [bacterium]
VPRPALDAVRGLYGLADAVTTGRPPPDGLCVVDAPPSGPAAEAVMESSDVCVVVASDRRYADASMWEMLDRGARRGVEFVFVLDRLPVSLEDQRPLLADFAGRLAGRGLISRAEPEAVIGIPEAPPGSPVPVEWGSGVRKELEVLADPLARRAISRRVLAGAFTSLRRALSETREAVVDVEVIRSRLIDARDSAYDLQLERLGADAVAGGLAGFGETIDTLSSDLAAVTVRRAGHAARDTSTAWERDVVGKPLLSADPGLWTHAPGGLERSRRAVDEWQDETGRMVGDASRWWTRRRVERAAADAISTMALGAGLDPATRRERSIRGRIDKMPGVVEEARGRLIEALQLIVSRDGERFSAVTGTGTGTGALARLILDDSDGGESS